MDEVDYCRDPADVRAIPGAAERLARLRRAGYATVIVTNQSGLGRGIITPAQYEAVQAELLRQLDYQIDATYFAPDAPPHVSARRKPGTGMIDEAVRDLDLTLAGSWFVGDKAIDIQCGRAAGVATILVCTGYGETERESAGADLVVPDINAALDAILSAQS